MGDRPRVGLVAAESSLLPDGDALAGVIAVTNRSGRHHVVRFRWACDTSFRKAITIFADNSRHAGPCAAVLTAQHAA